MRTLALLALGLAVPVGTVRAQASDSARVAEVVAEFHAALSAGDSAKALSLLADDVRILESGDLETWADYRAHHLPADIAFAQAVTSTRVVDYVSVRGDVAWVVSTSRTTGSFRDRPIRSAGAELMVLAREQGGWTIEAIHWSSRPMRTPPSAH